MYNYDYTVSVLINLYGICPFSGEKLTFAKFKSGYFHIDHIDPSRRWSKTVSSEEREVRNSIINLRPFKGTMHLNNERVKIDYEYPDRWIPGTWKKLEAKLYLDEYSDLLLKTPVDSNRIIGLSEQLFKETNCEIPDWFFLKLNKDGN